MPKISEMRKQETLDKIMKTASELFSKHGYHNTQVMDIVRAVGISAGTFYNYFKDKRDLFERIAQDNFENMRIHVRQFRRPFNIWDRNEEIRMLRESYTTLFDFVDQYPEIMLMLFRGGVRHR
jgi:AcrR family transcriptional regulator